MSRLVVIADANMERAERLREACAVRGYVTRIGGERNARAAPLSLDDGGVVLATSADLVVIDAEGNVAKFFETESL